VTGRCLIARSATWQFLWTDPVTARLAPAATVRV
jgi:hypothetical protein